MYPFLRVIFCADFKCDAPEIQALDEAFIPDRHAILKAQAAIRDLLHKEWFDLYVQYIAELKKKKALKQKAPKEVQGHWSSEKKVIDV